MVQAVSSQSRGRSFAGKRANSAARALEVGTTIARLIAEARSDRLASPIEIATRAQRTARSILATHGVEVHASGGAPTGPALIVANHLSYLDPLVVASAVPCIA